MEPSSAASETLTNAAEEVQVETATVAASAWNPNDYMVMVKPEYLLPPPAPPVSTTSSSSEGQGQQKSNKRPRDARANGMDKLCGQSRKGEACMYGEACRFRCVQSTA